MDNVGTMLDNGLVAPRVGIHMGGARRMVEFDRTSTALGTRSLSKRQRRKKMERRLAQNPRPSA